MTFGFEITARAKADRTTCFDYIARRSPEGALAWLSAFESAVEALLIQPRYGEAPESRGHDETIRQKIFKTKYGLPYRLLYIIRGETIYIIHVRGPGQDLMNPDDVEVPSSDEDE